MKKKIVISSFTFPPVNHADHTGFLAFGGDLSANRLLDAYSQGIFPWYSDPDPIMWWSPDPRFVLFPDELHISRSTRKFIKKNDYTFTFDTCFEKVVYECAQPRSTEKGTWITPLMHSAYCNLHHRGFAHSLEIWYEGKLAGGLYGISLGKAFFAESMFHLQENGSKLAVMELALQLKARNFTLIDAQIKSPHLVNWGAREIPRTNYVQLLTQALQEDTLVGNWNKETKPLKLHSLSKEKLHALTPIFYFA